MKISPDISKCLPNCEGVLVASFAKLENPGSPEENADRMFGYDQYKQETIFPDALKGYDKS